MLLSLETELSVEIKISTLNYVHSELLNLQAVTILRNCFLATSALFLHVSLQLLL